MLYCYTHYLKPKPRMPHNQWLCQVDQNRCVSLVRDRPRGGDSAEVAEQLRSGVTSVSSLLVVTWSPGGSGIHSGMHSGMGEVQVVQWIVSIVRNA